MSFTRTLATRSENSPGIRRRLNRRKPVLLLYAHTYSLKFGGGGEKTSFGSGRQDASAERSLRMLRIVVGRVPLERLPKTGARRHPRARDWRDARTPAAAAAAALIYKNPSAAAAANPSLLARVHENKY